VYSFRSVMPLFVNFAFVAGNHGHLRHRSTSIKENLWYLNGIHEYLSNSFAFHLPPGKWRTRANWPQSNGSSSSTWLARTIGTSLKRPGSRVWSWPVNFDRVGYSEKLSGFTGSALVLQHSAWVNLLKSLNASTTLFVVQGWKLRKNWMVLQY